MLASGHQLEGQLVHVALSRISQRTTVEETCELDHLGGMVKQNIPEFAMYCTSCLIKMFLVLFVV